MEDCTAEEASFLNISIRNQVNYLCINTSNKSYYLTNEIRGTFNKFPALFVQAFKIVEDSWEFSILLLYILWDDWPIFMITGSN